MKKIILTALLMGVATTSAAEEGVRADRILMSQDLHRHCSASEAAEDGRLSVGYCLGVITGIADAAMTLNVALSGRQTICLKANDTAEKMRISFLLFAEQRPEVLELPAATVVIASLQTYFKCEPL